MALQNAGPCPLPQKWSPAHFSSWEAGILLAPGAAWTFGNQRILLPFLSIFFPEVPAAIRGVRRQNPGAFGEEGPSPDVIKAMWMMFGWVEDTVILPPDRAHKYNLSFAPKAVNKGLISSRFPASTSYRECKEQSGSHGVWLPVSLPGPLVVLAVVTLRLRTEAGDAILQPCLWASLSVEVV